ncbi:MAG: DUF2157 domain-containing protein [Fusobacteriaceae bacterium]
MIEKLKNLLGNFATVFFISGISFFIAYNWSGMGNMEKLSIPLSLIGAGIGGWFFLEKRERYRQVSLFFASFFTGTLFALFGQIYQTGADAYGLFLSWGLAILLFSCVEKFYPLWTLNIAVLSLGTALFGRFHGGTVSALYAGGSVIYFFFLAYCFFIKKNGLKTKNWFFYLLPATATGLINGGVGYSIFRGEFLAIPFYLVFLTSLFFFGEKVMKKQGLNILGIISAVSVISNLSYKYLSRTREGQTFHTLLVIVIFLWTIKVIKEKFISTQSQQLVINVFKINLVIYLISLVSLLISLLGLKEGAFLLMGISFLGMAVYLPLKLKFKEDRSEIVTLISGMLCIIVYFSLILKFQETECFLLGMVIYGFFWYFRHSRALDFLLIPALTGGLLFISRDLGIKNLTPIIALPLPAILLSLEKSVVKSSGVKRAVRGGEITLILSGIVFYNSFFSSKISPPILSAGAVLLSLTILGRIFRDESRWKYIFMALLIGGVGYLFANEWSINLGIMLILLYLWREEKYMLGASVIFFAGQLGFYYYKIDTTLLEKSYVMFKNSLLLFTGFLILRREK